MKPGAVASALALSALLVLSGCAMSQPADPTPPATTASWTPLTWPDLTGRQQPKAGATISYGAAAEQKVDVWLPKGPGPHRTVLMVHGGCWQTDIADRTLMDWIAADLRDHQRNIVFKENACNGGAHKHHNAKAGSDHRNRRT